MNLREYLEMHKITYEAFAKSIGLSSARTVQRYVTGERYPRRGILSLIHKQTAGMVTANDFNGDTAMQDVDVRHATAPP